MIGRAQLALILKTITLVYMTRSAVNCGDPTKLGKNYCSKTLHNFSSNDARIVELTAHIININKFDEMSGELSLTMALTLMWMERRLSWNISDQYNITSIPINLGDIWRPQVYLLQSLETMVDIADTNEQARLHNDGRVLLKIGRVIKVACYADLEDVQNCSLTLLNWAIFENEMKFVPMNATMHQPNLNRNSQWELVDGKLSSCNEPEFENVPCLTIVLSLKRHGTFYMISILVSLILFPLTNLTAFLIISPSSGQRTSVAIAVYLSCLVFVNTIQEVLPQGSEQVSCISRVTIYLLIQCWISLLLCIISQNLYNSSDSPIPWYVSAMMQWTKFERFRSRTLNQYQWEEASFSSSSINVNEIAQQDSSGQEKRGNETDLEEQDMQKTENTCVPLINVDDDEQQGSSKEHDRQMTGHKSSETDLDLKSMTEISRKEYSKAFDMRCVKIQCLITLIVFLFEAYTKLEKTGV